MAVSKEDHINILIELNKAVKAHHFYPQGHPNLKTSLKHCLDFLKKVLQEHGEIKWKVQQRFFFDGKSPIAQDNHQISSLASKFFVRRIKEIILRPEMTEDDLRTIIDIITTEPGEIQARGGVESIIGESPLKGIVINSMNYNDIARFRKEIDDRKDDGGEIGREEAREVAEGNGQVDTEGEGGGADTTATEDASQRQGDVFSALEFLKTEDTPDDEDISTLLGRIKEETDPKRYRELAGRIVGKSKALISKNLLHDLYPVISVLSRHLTGDLPEDIKEIARKSIDSILTEELINYLVKRFVTIDEKGGKEMEGTILACGDRVIGPLLDVLSESEETVVRRRLFNILVRFGERIRTEVEKRLNSEKWFVVRQMVALLGVVGDERSVTALGRIWDHPNVKVKREVLKTLARIPSPGSTRILINALDDKDKSVKIQAMISLGLLKDPASVDALGRIVNRWTPFSNNLDERREAIKALGIIGDSSATPYLERLLTKRVWFGKRAFEELRILAVNALGRIGTREALAVVEKVLQKSQGRLHNICKSILTEKTR